MLLRTDFVVLVVRIIEMTLVICACDMSIFCFKFHSAGMRSYVILHSIRVILPIVIPLRVRSLAGTLTPGKHATKSWDAEHQWTSCYDLHCWASKGKLHYCTSYSIFYHKNLVAIDIASVSLLFSAFLPHTCHLLFLWSGCRSLNILHVSYSGNHGKMFFA